MKTKFNLSRYKELLAMENRNRGEIMFLDENFLKLLSYQTTVSKQLISDKKKIIIK